MFLGRKHSNLSGGGPFREMSWWVWWQTYWDHVGLSEREGGYTLLYSPSDSLPKYPNPFDSGGSGGRWTVGYLLTLPVHHSKIFSELKGRKVREPI